MKNVICKISGNEKFDSLEKLQKYYFWNQIIPIVEIMVLLFFIRVSWVRNNIGNIVLELVYLLCLTIYVVRLIHLYKSIDQRFKKFPFVLQDLINVVTILLSLIIFVLGKLIKIDSIVLECGVYLYLICFELGILVYVSCNSLVGTYSSKFKKEIGNFYDYLSRSAFNHFSLLELIKIIEDESELNIFLKPRNVKQIKAKNIIRVLGELRNQDLAAYIELKSKVKFNATKNLVAISALFVTVVNIFIMRYFNSIMKWIKEFGSKNNYFQDIVYGFALGLILSVIVIVYENIKVERCRGFYQKMLMYFEEAEKK